MRIALFGTRKEPSVLEKMEQVGKILKASGVDVDSSYFEGSLDQMKEDLEFTYNKVKKIIQRADTVVVDLTNYSTGMGLIIGRVIGYKKPMLILFDKEAEGKERPILARAHGTKKNKVFYREYTSKTLDTILDEFVNESKKMLNTKYLFNLTPDLAHYLQWASEKYHKPMVDILREVLYERMEEDKEWKKHLDEK